MHRGSAPLTVHIVQPALPTYRIPFFRTLQSELSKGNRTLRVYASRRDHLGVVSVAPDGFEGRVDSTMSVYGGGRVLLQAPLTLPLAKGDVLVINGNPRLLSNYPLWIRAKRLGIPVLWWGHGWSGGSHGKSSALRRQIMRLADAVILYTDKERDEYIALGFAPGRTFALNNGLDVRSIDKAAAEWDSERIRVFRRSHGLDACAHWCIFVGRISVKSRIDLLIESFGAIRGDVGLIALGDGPAAAQAMEKARQLGVASRIVWVGSEFDEAAIAPWMLSASAFVYPGMVGLSLIHGFAYGLPAVVHGDRSRQMPEYAAFEDQGNGLSFEYGSAQSLAMTINRLFEDTAHLAEMARQAAALVHRTFNVDDMSRRFMEAIESFDRRAPSGG
jgi:glycosyltransferase involved in cell wall biosynthesis